MPRTNPRITVGLNPEAYAVIDHFACLQKRSKAAVVAELIESVTPAMARTVALIQAAQEAPAQVSKGLVTVLEQLEVELTAATTAAESEMRRIRDHVQPSSSPPV